MEELAKQAASESGWVAGMFALLVAGGFTALGLIVRQLWSDHRELGAFVRSEMRQTILTNAKAMNRLAAVMRGRPCLARDSAQIEEVAESGEQTAMS